MQEGVSYSVLRMIVGCPNSYSYVKALLDHGASIDSSDNVFRADKFTQLMDGLKSQSNKHNKIVATQITDNFSFKPQLLCNSDLIEACAYS